MTATQSICALDGFELTLASDKPDIAAEKLLGQPARVAVALRDEGKRHFNGLVTRFGFGGARERHFHYQATIRPWLWFLTRTADCRIFQGKTVPEIVKDVFADHGGIANYAFELFRTYRARSYCVQYRETDYNFVARLLEEEGIYWYFEHAEGEHKLVLVDDLGALSPAEGADKLPFYENAAQMPPGIDYISGWNCSREVRTGKTALTSYDFERPSTNLAVLSKKARSHPLDDYEQFDFDGEYTQKADGQQLAACQLEEHQMQFERVSGHTNSHALAVGHLFKLERHPRGDQNAEYLCLQSHVALRQQAQEAGTGDYDFQCSFSGMATAQPFRPQRLTPKPFVQGPQTAVVVGPGGDEIFTDKYGRVKVQFHWDRYGKKDDKSSCWVRVSHPWAGKNFGAVQIPRIGQEVVVDFLEGDPDQPLITGRIYNAEQMPPWDLPANATQSGILTRSSKGGAYGNANAIRFEDKKGAEQLWMHAEKNQDIEVENDETHWVGHDRTKTIDHDETVHVKHDRTETVDNNETITVHHDRSERVDNNETISIGVNRSEDVGKNENISIGVNRTESVGDNESVSVGKNRSMDIGDNETLSVGKNREHSVGKNETITIGDNLQETIGKNVKTEIGENRQTSIAKDDKTQVGKKFYLEAGDEITLKTGDASLTMKKDGTIQLKGKDITVIGSGKIGIKASGDLVLKGSKIAEN